MRPHNKKACVRVCALYISIWTMYSISLSLSLSVSLCKMSMYVYVAAYYIHIRQQLEANLCAQQSWIKWFSFFFFLFFVSCAAVYAYSLLHIIFIYIRCMNVCVSEKFIMCTQSTTTTNNNNHHILNQKLCIIAHIHGDAEAKIKFYSNEKPQ